MIGFVLKRLQRGGLMTVVTLVKRFVTALVFLSAILISHFALGGLIAFVFGYTTDGKGVDLVVSLILSGGLWSVFHLLCKIGWDK